MKQKRAALVFLVVLLAATSANAQWTCSPANCNNPQTVYTSSTSTNVGLGTSTPLTIFDVKAATNKHLSIRPASDFGGLSNAIALHAFNDGATAAIPFSIESYVLTLNAATRAAVGIGTTAPGLFLDVKATSAGVGFPASTGTTQTGIFRLSQDAGAGVLDFGIAGTNQLGAWLQATASNNLSARYDLLLNPMGGNVGIGVQGTPKATLALPGGMGAAGQIGLLGNAGSGQNKPGLFLGSNGNFNGTNATAYFGLTASPTNYPYDFAIVGSADSNLHRFLHIGYNTGDDPSAAFNPRVSIDTYAGNINVAGQIVSQGGFSGPTAAGNVSGGAFGATSAGGNYTFPANVGIGTTTPGTRLDIGAGVTPRGADSDLVIGTTVPQIEFYGSATSAAMHYDGNVFRIWTNGGATWKNALSVGNNGKVGIGVSDPQAYDLHLYRSDAGTKSLGIEASSGGAGSYADADLLSDKMAVSLRTYGSGFDTFLHAGFHLANMSELWADELAAGVGGGKGLLIGTGGSQSSVSPVIFATRNTERMRIMEDGRVVIGATAPTGSYALDVVGSIHATNIIGASYQDVAEWVPASEEMKPGTVVVLAANKNNEVTSSRTAYDTMVAGVVSARPGIILGDSAPDKAQVATTGRVKVKVDATRNPIRVGDLLVTSDVAGTAMRSVPIDVSGIAIHRPGTIIGKALEPLASGEGEILVLLSLQ